jgi:phosphate transport system protein
MRKTFDEQLRNLNEELLEMGALIEQAINSASKALIDRNRDAAEDAIAFDKEIDNKEREIETMCIKMLLQQQPVARDLRQISSALKMVTDMERIGDQAADISGLVMYLIGKPNIKTTEHLIDMAKAAAGMVTGSIDAYVKKDVELAHECIKTDDVIDSLFMIVKGELIDIMKKGEDVEEQAADLLLIAKYFERIGDHAQNIAEWVEYSITGKYKGEYV